MKLNLISLATVKLELGLVGVEYDAAITAMIPRVSADVRRILNYQFNKMIDADGATGNAQISLQVGQEMGRVVEADNLPDDTYIVAYNANTGEYTLSSAPTGVVTSVTPTVLMSQWSTISKMIWYRIQKMTTKSADDKRIASESYGPVSITYADSEINAKWNYPQVLIDDLGVPFSEIG